MSVKFPDILRHENENYAIVDINDIRGIYIVESLDAIQEIPEDKRRGGAIASIIGSGVYRYNVGSVSDESWNEPSNWKEVGGSSSAGNGITIYGSQNDITALSYDDHQPCVYCNETQQIYKYVRNGSEYEINPPYVLPTSDADGNGRYVSLFHLNSTTLTAGEGIIIDRANNIISADFNVVARDEDLERVANEVLAIEELIPNQATPENQLADKDFVNSSIENMAGSYITSNPEGEPFDSHYDLLNAETYYYNGHPYVPTDNDYAYVKEDEDHPVQSSPEIYPWTRYRYTAEGSPEIGQWNFQCVVNNSPFTEAQWKAINSGITEELVKKIKDLKNPDWNQNDENASNFIEHRTHYEYGENAASFDTDGESQFDFDWGFVPNEGEVYTIKCIVSGDEYEYRGTAVLSGDSQISVNFGDGIGYVIYSETSTFSGKTGRWVGNSIISHVDLSKNSIKKLDRKYLYNIEAVHYKKYSDLPESSYDKDLAIVDSDTIFDGVISSESLTDKGTYRLPKSEEFVYMLSTRTDHDERRFRATLTDVGINGVKGLIVLPDAFDLTLIDYPEDSYGKLMTIAEFEEIDELGATFLPCAGNIRCAEYQDPSRYVLQDFNANGWYWTSSYYSNFSRALANSQNDGIVGDDYWHSYFPLSVRLVEDCESDDIAAISVDDDTYFKFTKGNLQYDLGTRKWYIAENQWDCLGESNLTAIRANEGRIDLIQYSQSGYNGKIPMSGNVYNGDIAGTEYDTGVHNRIYEYKDVYGERIYRPGSVFEYSEENKEWIPISGYSIDDEKLKNLVDGKYNQGAVRGINTIEEDDTVYQVGENTMVIGESTMASGKFSLVAGKDNMSSGKGSFVVGELNRSNAQFGFIGGSNNTSYNEYETIFGADNISHSRFDLIVGSGNRVYQASQSEGYNNIFGYGNIIDGSRYMNVFGVQNTSTGGNYIRLFGSSNDVYNFFSDIIDISGHNNDVGDGIGGYSFIRGAYNRHNSGGGQFMYIDGADNEITNGAGGYEFLRGSKNTIANGCSQFIYIDGVNLRAYNSSYSQIKGTTGLINNSYGVFTKGFLIGLNAEYKNSSRNDFKLPSYSPSSLSYSFFEGDKILVENGGHALYARGVDIAFTRTLMDGTTIDSNSPWYVFVHGDQIRIYGNAHNIYAQGVGHNIQQSAYANIFGNSNTVDGVGSALMIMGTRNSISKLKSDNRFSGVWNDGTIFFGTENDIEKISTRSAFIGGSGNHLDISDDNKYNAFIDSISILSNSGVRDSAISSSSILGSNIGIVNTYVYSSYVNGNQSTYTNSTITNSLVSIHPKHEGSTDIQSTISGYITNSIASISGAEITSSLYSSVVTGTNMSLQGGQLTNSLILCNYFNQRGNIYGSIVIQEYASIGDATNNISRYVGHSTIIGSYNDVKSDTYDSYIHGTYNSYGGSGNILFGSYNSVYPVDASYASTQAIVFGSHNTYKQSSFGAIIGSYSSCTGNYSLILGYNSSVTASQWGYNRLHGYYSSTVSSDFSSSSGVQNSINQSNFSFVHGDTNNISNGDHNTVFGTHNISTNNSKVVILGCNYNVYSSSNSLIVGTGKYDWQTQTCIQTVKNMYNSLIVGDENNLSPEGSCSVNSSVIFGHGNNFLQSTYINTSLIVGNNNTLEGQIKSSIIAGYGNYYKDENSENDGCDIIVGSGNTILPADSDMNAVFGGGNNFQNYSGTNVERFLFRNNIVSGSGNNDSQYRSSTSGSIRYIENNAIFGVDNKLGNVRNSIIAGCGNSISKAINSGIIGVGNTYTSKSKLSDGSWTEGNVNTILNSYANHTEGEANYVDGYLNHTEGLGRMNVTVTAYNSSSRQYFIEGSIGANDNTYLDFGTLSYVGMVIMNNNRVSKITEKEYNSSESKYVYTLSDVVSNGNYYVRSGNYGKISHIEGFGNLNDGGPLNHIEGVGNYCSGTLSHIDGVGNNIHYATASHVGGQYNTNYANISFIHGRNVSIGSTSSELISVIGSDDVAVNNGTFHSVLGSYGISISGLNSRISVISSDNITLSDNNVENVVILGMSNWTETNQLESNTVYVNNIDVAELTNASIDALFE